MKSIVTHIMIVLSFFPHLFSNTCFAGGYSYGSRSYGYSRSYCYPSYNQVYSNKIVVSKVANISAVTIPVAFLPSQVLLNGQITLYGAPTTQSIGYSYQGGYATQQQLQQVQQQYQQPQQYQQQQNTYVQPQQQLQQHAQYQQQQGGQGQATQEAQTQQANANPQGQAVLTDNQRLSNLEQKLDAVLNKMGGGDPQQIQGIQIFSDLNSCKKCHMPGTEGYEKLPMFDQEGQMLPEQKWFDIITAVMKNPGEQGFMPKGGQKLIPEVIQRVQLHASEKLKGRSY